MRLPRSLWLVLLSVMLTNISDLAGASAAGTSEYFKTIYNFRSHADGNGPFGALIDVGGTLYGTTIQGGLALCGSPMYPSGCGTVFSVTPDGTERVLYRFRGGYDGAYPSAGLTVVNGVLYGTTRNGGAPNCGDATGCGTVFAITTSGVESVIARFLYDGAYPGSQLLNVNGTLYGTTESSVFALSTSGALRTIYQFKGTPDGTEPRGRLIDVNGTLYGTTSAGGTHNDGTVYAISAPGTERVLYNFAGSGSGDGANPYAGVIDVNGTLYGTTAFGGTFPCNGVNPGCGTVFSLSPSGKERVQSLRGGYGPSQPQAELVDVNGTLYGTAYYGGQYPGAIFEVCPLGIKTLANTAANPTAPLLSVNGILYGTTSFGGAYAAGTIFAFKP